MSNDSNHQGQRGKGGKPGPGGGFGPMGMGMPVQKAKNFKASNRVLKTL